MSLSISSFFSPKNPYSCIPVDHPILGRVRELLPPEYWGNTWVAGSAATRFGQHGDVDVWVTDAPRTQDLWKILPCNEGKEAPPIMQDSDDYEHICIKIYNNLDEKLQIMALHEDIHHLLSKFDISVHCGAMNLQTGERLRGPGYSEKVTIINYLEGNPHLSLTRYLNFSKRYKDYSGYSDPNVQACASTVFNLKTSKDMEAELKYCYVDRGL